MKKLRIKRYKKLTKNKTFFEKYEFGIWEI